MSFFLGCQSQEIELKAHGYFLDYDEQALNESFGAWALSEMTTRGNSSFVKKYNGIHEEGYKLVKLAIDPKLPTTYCVENNGDVLTFTIKNQRDGQWLIFQFLERLGQQDSRIMNADLPLATVNFNTHCKTFDFEYREPFLPSNLLENNTLKFGTNSIDMDWGIWGHNLSKITTPEDDIFATVKNQKDKNQFCFSSDLLYNQIVTYIIDNYGEGVEALTRFMIMPNDNDLVCVCDLCVAAGNTANNASPAVAKLINALADRFPNFQIFTSAYRTTQIPPEEKLRENTGVFISTINIPQGIALQSNVGSTRIFLNEMEQWKTKTSHLYVWDYLGNFDDYLTPAPGLFGLQARLKFFKEHGASGIFLNASGYDYSTFEDVKTAVAALLLIETEIDIEPLIKAYFKKFYSEYHQDLSDYYLSMEKEFSKKNVPLDMYGGTRENLKTYTDIKDFQKLFRSIQADRSPRSFPETMQKMIVAFNFTQLQIAYATPPNALIAYKKSLLKPDNQLKTFLQNLSAYKNYTDLKVYREEQGALEDYLYFWKEDILRNSLQNKILNEKIVASPSNEDTNLLTDGLPGYVEDYHQGWFISDNDVSFQWKSKFSAKEISLHFLVDKKHRFSFPKRVTLTINNKKNVIELTTGSWKKLNRLRIPVSLKKGDVVHLQIDKTEGLKNKIAIDEIRIF